MSLLYLQSKRQNMQHKVARLYRNRHFKKKKLKSISQSSRSSFTMCVLSKQSFSNLGWSKFSSLAPFVSATAPYSSNTCTSSCMFSLHIMFGTSREGSRLRESRDCCGFSDKAAKSTTSRRLQFWFSLGSKEKQQ